MPRSDTPADHDVARQPDAPVDDPAADRESSLAEAVAATLGGMVLGTAALWFLAPICFTC